MNAPIIAIACFGIFCLRSTECASAYVEKLSKQGYTQERIGTILDVSHQTVGRDLNKLNLSIMDKLKPEKMTRSGFGSEGRSELKSSGPPLPATLSELLARRNAELSRPPPQLGQLDEVVRPDLPPGLHVDAPGEIQRRQHLAAPQPTDRCPGNPDALSELGIADPPPLHPLIQFHAAVVRHAKIFASATLTAAVRHAYIGEKRRPQMKLAPIADRAAKRLLAKNVDVNDPHLEEVIFDDIYFDVDDLDLEPTNIVIGMIVARLKKAATSASKPERWAMHPWSRLDRSRF